MDSGSASSFEEIEIEDLLWHSEWEDLDEGLVQDEPYVESSSSGDEKEVKEVIHPKKRAKRVTGVSSYEFPSTSFSSCLFRRGLLTCSLAPQA